VMQQTARPPERSSDELRRRVYLIALALVAPILPVIAYVQAGVEPFAVPAYAALFVGLASTLVGLLTRRLPLERAEHLVVVGVSGVVMARLVGAAYLTDLSSGELRQLVVETIGPTLVACVLVIFLATRLRQARRWAIALCLSFTLVLLPRIVSEWPVDPGFVVALSRQALTLVIVAGLAYGLASLKTQLAEERVRAQALDELANTDPLTGIRNRRGGQQALEHHLAMVDRYGGELCVALFDLDNFKLRNDHLGHAAGDEALIDVVARLQQELRASDVLVRWGGDELLVIAPGIVRDAAVSTAERWRAVVAELGLSAGPAQVTASIGLALHRPGDTLDTLLTRADRALYVAKGRGGDAVGTDEALTDNLGPVLGEAARRDNGEVQIITLPDESSTR
jgi:diguanylate cyclase (GGDEF)-like protein